MNINNLIVDQSSVSVLRIAFGNISKKSTTNGFLYFGRIFATRNHVQFVSVHNTQHLLSDVLGALQRPVLNKILEAPSARKIVRCRRTAKSNGLLRFDGTLPFADRPPRLSLSVCNSIDTMVRASSAQPKCTLIINILDNWGSSGNSAMRRPSLVKRPSSSRALKACSCSMAMISVSMGGGSIKSNESRSFMPMAFSDKTVDARLSVALSRSSSAGSACSLLCLSLRDRSDHQAVHTCLGVVDLLLDKAGVDHIEYSVDGERCFGNVGGDYDFS
ncbi:hypothetical protein BpHYR1_023412 [Brachionus plicatilis]|uniref:Uncharacterized protein n=1 Tax=Brachionus plicatilis TaxID=10195 RepID=A0A3M7QZL9_BRAPC|nr:hypothetical protein BpHYR1_023412 [Brachionus plicatilis]